MKHIRSHAVKRSFLLTNLGQSLSDVLPKDDGRPTTSQLCSTKYRIYSTYIYCILSHPRPNKPTHCSSIAISDLYEHPAYVRCIVTTELKPWHAAHIVALLLCTTALRRSLPTQVGYRSTSLSRPSSISASQHTSTRRLGPVGYHSFTLETTTTVSKLNFSSFRIDTAAPRLARFWGKFSRALYRFNRTTPPR